jgi:hypothetical protein
VVKDKYVLLNRAPTSNAWIASGSSDSIK